MIAAAIILMAADIIRLFLLPQTFQETFTDGFEALVVLLCTVACGYAAARSRPVGRGLWLMTAVFFALNAAADTHDLLAGLSLNVEPLSSAFEVLGWSVYLPLALLIFFPIEKDGRPDWTWLPLLDFLLVTEAAAVAYFRLIYIPHLQTGQPWTIIGQPEAVRNVLLSAGLLLRSGIDPSSRARTIYFRVGVVYAGVVLLRMIFPGYANPVYALIRPALWLLLGILAVRWEDGPERTAEGGKRRAALRWFLSFSSAVTLLVVVVLGWDSPSPFKALLHACVGLSVGLFIIRGFQAERSRYASEIQLRNSERDYRLLFESAIVPIVIFELASGRILQANSAACEMYRVPLNGLMGANMKDFIKNDARAEEQITKMLREGTCLKFESVHRTTDGEELEVWVSSSVIRYRGRKAILSFNRDITERKRAEERFAKAFGAIPVPVTISSLSEGRYMDVNEAFLRATGYARDEVIGRTSVELKFWPTPGDRERFLEAFKRGPVRGLEITFATKFGELRSGRLSGELIMLGGERCLLAITNDVTEQKRAQDSLLKLKHAVDASGEVIFMTDRDGVITSINPEFTRLYGYTAEELVGKTTPRILKSGEFSSDHYARFWTAIRNKKIVRGDVVNKTKEGRLVTVESSVNPILDDRKEITGFLAIQRDITARKQLEEQFRQAQKMDAIGRLAGGVAHDFNNLLTIINGYAQLLEERFTEDERVGAQVGEILKAGNRATALTRQLLAFSRRQVLEPKDLDLASVVEGMQTMLRRIIGEDVELKVALHKPFGLVKADPTQMEQAIMNLVVNARDAMPHGGKLTIEAAATELDQTYSASHPEVTPGQYVMLAVRDSGIGMDSQTLAHIFEPFFTTKERGKGTGLGLSTVYGIVKQTRGYIMVYSEPGKGTTFKMFFPLAAATSEASRAAEAKVMPLRGTETVLIVEDEDAVRGLAVSVLRGYGYHVLETASPQEATRIGEDRQQHIDLLLTDVVMPGMSGRNVAEHLAFLRPELKVLYMSGYTDDAILHHGVLQAGVAFIQKPFTPEALARKIRDVLDASQGQAYQAA